MHRVTPFQFAIAVALASAHGHEWAAAAAGIEPVPADYVCVQGSYEPSAHDIWCHWNDRSEAYRRLAAGESLNGLRFALGWTARFLGDLAHDVNPHEQTMGTIRSRTMAVRAVYDCDESMPGISNPWVDEAGDVVHTTGSGRLSWRITPEGDTTLTVWRPTSGRPESPADGHADGTACLVAHIPASPGSEIKITDGPAVPFARHLDTMRRALEAIPGVGAERAWEATRPLAAECAAVVVQHHASGAREWMDPSDLEEGSQWAVVP